MAQKKLTEEMKIREVALASCGTQIFNRHSQIIERPGWYQVITPQTKYASNNEVIHSALQPEDTERVLRETIRQYAAHDLPFKWCVGPLTKPDHFGDLLENHGFTHWNIRGMTIVPYEAKIAPVPGVTVERVGLENADDFIATFSEGWSSESPADPAESEATRQNWISLLEDRGDAFQFFLARFQGKPTGTAGFALKPNSAYLLRGNVLPQYRGRGIYRALIRERLGVLAGLSVPLATTRAREATSAPILEHLGFETLFRSKVYQLSRPPRIRRVLADYAVTYTDAIQLKKGETVRLLPKANEPEWIGWHWCVNSRGNEGWISESFLKIDGEHAEVIRSYDAKELAANRGDSVRIFREDHGWLWCEDMKGEVGWIPSRNVDSPSP